MHIYIAAGVAFFLGAILTWLLLTKKTAALSAQVGNSEDERGKLEKKADALKAIEAMNGKELRGKLLEVKEAVEKKSRFDKID